MYKRSIRVEENAPSLQTVIDTPVLTQVMEQEPELEIMSKIFGDKNDPKKPVVNDKPKELVLDIEKIFEMVIKLKPYATESTDKLNYQTKIIFFNFKKMVSLIRNTDYYSEFYSQVIDKFLEEREAQLPYLPGTVGAYITGCNQDGADLPFSIGCTPTCAGSMEHPSTTSHCDKTILLWKSDKNYITLLDRTASSKEGILYFPSIDLKDWKGLSKDSKNALKAFGVHTVKVIGFSGDNMKEFTSEAVPMEKISSIAPQEGTGGGGGGLLVGLILGALILAVVYLYMVQRKKAN